MVARSTLFDGACWDPQHWTYLAEGAANVLIRYIGPETGPFVGFNGTYRIALRLPKIQYNRPPSKTLQPDIFIERVLSKLLPVDTLPVLYRIPNENEMHSFLREIKSKCEPLRPASRRKTGSIDPDAPYIWATHDLSNVPDAKVGLVIEVKVCLFANMSPNVDIYLMDQPRSLLNESIHATACCGYIKQASL